MRRGPRSLTRWKDPGLPGYGYGCAGGEVKVACADVGVPDAGEAAARARATIVPPARRWGGLEHRRRLAAAAVRHRWQDGLPAYAGVIRSGTPSLEPKTVQLTIMV